MRISCFCYCTADTTIANSLKISGKIPSFTLMQDVPEGKKNSKHWKKTLNTLHFMPNGQHTKRPSGVLIMEHKLSLVTQYESQPWYWGSDWWRYQSESCTIKNW